MIFENFVKKISQKNRNKKSEILLQLRKKKKRGKLVQQSFFVPGKKSRRDKMSTMS